MPNSTISQSHKMLLTAGNGQTGVNEAAQAYQNTSSKDGGSAQKQTQPLKKQSSLKKFDQRLYQQSYTKVFVMGDTKHGQLGFLNPNANN